MIIDKYLVRQVAMPCLLVSAVLMIIFVGYALSRFLTEADAGLLSTGEVIRLTVLKLLIALEVLLPVGLFFGLMLGLGKLHHESEIVALQASGVGEFRMLRSIAALAIPLALVIAALSIVVRPWAYAQTYQTLSVAEASSDIDRIKAGQFYLTRKASGSPADAATGLENESLDPQLSGQKERDQERAIFVEKISPDQALEHIFIRTRIGEELQVISSQTGLLVEQPNGKYHKLELDNARIFKRVEDGPDLFARIEHFTMRVVNEQPEPPAYKAKAVASDILAGSPAPKDQAEYQWRLSTAVTTLLFAMIAIPLSRSKPRQGRYARMLLAFVVYAVYFNLIRVNRTWIEQQATTAIWWTPCLLALVVALCYMPWRSLNFALTVRNNE